MRRNAETQSYRINSAVQGEVGQSQNTPAVQPSRRERGHRSGRLNKALASATTLVLLVPGMIASMGNTNENRGLTTPPSNSKIDVTCNVSAGLQGHSASKEHPLGNQGWQTFENKSKKQETVVFGTWVDILGRFHHKDKWHAYKKEIQVPVGFTGRVDWIVSQTPNNNTSPHMDCSKPQRE